MTYTINNNSVNVWIRDYDDTMDLSPETDAGAVYLNNGRTLEQELGEGSMVSNVVTVNSAMSKVIDETYDGAYESLVLKGRSLVNLCPNKVIDYVATSDWDGFNGLGQASNTKGYSWKTLQDLKPNTKYFISCYVETFDVGKGEYYLFNNNNQSTVFNDTLTIYSTGLHKWVLTSKIEFTEEVFVALRCQNAYARGAIKIRDIMVIPYQEGMENWDVPFFTGLCDVKMPVVKNIGKNLFDINKIENAEIAGAYNYVKIPIHPNKEYSCSYDANFSTTGYVNIGFSTTPWGASDVIVSWLCHPLSSTSQGIRKFSSGKYDYVYINWSEVSAYPHETYRKIFETLQIEESSTQTSYESYKSNTLTTPEEIILRSLPNGAQDTYNPLTGEYVKRVGEVVLNNDKKWSKTYRADSTIVSTFQLQLDDLLTRAEGNVDDLIIDKIFTSQSHAIWDKNIEGIHNKKNYLFVNINNSRMNGDTVDSFKSWLLSNPIKVQYELAEPIIKKVEPKGHPFAYEDGHVILESGHQGQSLLPTMDYSTVINRTGQIKSIGEQSLRQDKQINKLEQMLVSNIIAMNYNNTLLKLNLTMNEVK